MRTVSRRLLLAGGALLPTTPRAWAQAGGVEELHGALAAGNAAGFGRFVSGHAGRTVSLRLEVAPAEGRDFSVSLDGGRLIVNLPRPERMEIVAHGGFVRLDRGYGLDGVFTVRPDGMQQGILIYGLDPVPEARARAVRAGALRRVAL
jgi:hypothetical protein